MIGRGRTRTRGIYLLAGDILMVCLAGPDAKSRPTDFSSPEGSNNLLMTLKRVRPTPITSTVTARAVAPTTPTTPTTTTTQVSRNTPATPAGTVTFTPAGPPKPPPPPVDPAIAMRQKLIGTWGHQDDNEVFLVTFNWDGSFSSTRTPKRGFRKIFRDPTRTSGSWNLENGVIVIRVTASTERDLQGQILSYRIRSLSDTQAVLIDSTGRMHVQWKTP